MMKPAMFLVLGLGTLCLSACETGTPEERAAASAPDSSAAERKPEAAPVVAAAEPAPTRRVAVSIPTPNVGILECDQIANKYKECLETKIHGVNRTSLTHSLDFSLKRWHEIQDKGGDAAAVLAECQKTEAYAKQLLKPFGCDF